MFEDILLGLGSAAAAVYDWFWTFLEDGYGSIAITVVLGMVIFSIIFRFILMPLFGHRFDASSIRSGVSDAVKNSRIKDHPDFSERG